MATIKICSKLLGSAFNSLAQKIHRLLLVAPIVLAFEHIASVLPSKVPPESFVQ